jgi:hypothetical protein
VWKWKPQLIIAEQNSIGQPVIEQLTRDGLRIQPFTTTNASKAQAIEALALAFERGDIRIPNDPVLVSELVAYQAERLPSGLMRYGAPGGQYDDTVMALAMAWSAVSGQHRLVYPVPDSEIVVQEFTIPDPYSEIRLFKTPISTGGGLYPQWGAGGRELYYVSPDFKLMVVNLKLGAESVEPSAPRELFPLPAVDTGFSPYEATPDGRRFLVRATAEYAVERHIRGAGQVRPP